MFGGGYRLKRRKKGLSRRGSGGRGGGAFGVGWGIEGAGWMSWLMEVLAGVLLVMGREKYHCNLLEFPRRRSPARCSGRRVEGRLLS